MFLLLVHSEVQEHDRRRIIRETYGRMALDNNVFLVFNIGRTPEDLTSRFQTELIAESDENRDILQHNIIEHPWNLTLLALEGLQWYQSEYSTSIPYILHLRSDTFVDVRKWSYIFRLINNWEILNFLLFKLLKLLVLKCCFSQNQQEATGSVVHISLEKGSI